MSAEKIPVKITVKNQYSGETVTKFDTVITRPDGGLYMIGVSVLDQLGLTPEMASRRHSLPSPRVSSEYHSYGYNIFAELAESKNPSIPAISTYNGVRQGKRYKILVRWEKPKTLEQLVKAFIKAADKSNVDGEYESARSALLEALAKKEPA